MHLLPTLRQKKRYVTFEIRAKDHFSLAEIQEEVQNALLLFFGQWGLAKSSPLFIREKYSHKNQRFIIKINHKYVDELRAALTLIKKIKNQPVMVRSLITSGTLKTASSYLEK